MKKQKQSKLDFTIDLLPKTRIEVYKDVIKNHFSKLLWLGLVLFLGLLPFNLLIINRDLALLQLFEQFQGGLIDQQIFLQEKMAMNQTLSMTLVLALIFFSIFLSGAIRIIKRLGFLEPVSLVYDFTKGIKQNFKQYVVLFFGIGIWIAFSYFIYHLSILNQAFSEQLIYDFLGVLPFVIGVAILLPVVCYTIVIISVYQNRFSRQIKLGLVVFLSRILPSLGLTLILFIPWSLYLIPHIIVHMMLMIILPFILPFLMLMLFLKAMSILDYTINRKHYPSLYKKGLLGLTEKDQ